ncbi:MAG: RidA family protein [Gammaproteobacteria bacterium]|nr:RidA family protein [Gammaproteobacteria bacterium]
MNNLETIHSDAAPAAIGPYSQAVRVGSLIFCSGQIPLVPDTMEIIKGDIAVQARQVFDNLKAVAEAGETSLDRAVKITIFLTDLGEFTTVNEIMTDYFNEPYPARATFEVAALPKGASIEIDAVLAV